MNASAHTSTAGPSTPWAIRSSPRAHLAFDFGFDQYFAAHRLKLSTSYFYTRLQNVIAYGATPVNDPYGRYGGYIDAGGGIARGVEVAGEARPWRTLLLRASYVYTNAIEKNSAAHRSRSCNRFASSPRRAHWWRPRNWGNGRS